MSDKVYILLKDYRNDGTYEDFIRVDDEFVGVFPTEEAAIIVARKQAIANLSNALDTLGEGGCACFSGYKEYRDELGRYIIEFSKLGHGDFAFVSGEYTYKILPTCMDSEPKSYEPKVNIDIQPSYESIKAAETAFNAIIYAYDDHVAPLDIDKVEKDFSEEFIREQNNLSNGKEV